MKKIINFIIVLSILIGIVLSPFILNGCQYYQLKKQIINLENNLIILNTKIDNIEILLNNIKDK